MKFQNNRDKAIILKDFQKGKKEKKQTHIKDYESGWYQLSQQHCNREENLQNSGRKVFPPYLQICICPPSPSLTLLDPIKLSFKCEGRIVISDLQIHTQKFTTHAMFSPTNS